tara:strand:- start:65 stop:298 length:234 start_codon:yes stop_codon:yes gene_type:complete
MFKTQTFANMKKKDKRCTRVVPKDNTKQALKVLRAHYKFGNQTLNPDQVDEIPGLETLNIGEDKNVSGFNNTNNLIF